MKIPFRHAGHAGEVRVRLGRSRGPVESGFDILDGPHSRLDSTGFPTMRASVSYDGKGYRRFFGWIQIVDYESASVVDMSPSLAGLGLPFAALGECPVLFDSPATARRPSSFSALAFLCAVPLIDRKTPIRPLAGFTWGYEIDNSLTIRARTPAALPKGAWRALVPLLKKAHPRWTYAKS